MLCLLLLLASSVLGAPSDSLPAAVVPPTVNTLSSAAAAAPQAAQPSSAVAAAPQAIQLVPSANPDAADPDVKEVEESLNKLKIKLRDAVAALVAPPTNPVSADKKTKEVEASVGLNVPEISIKPIEVTANKKYAEIIGQFIADLIQIPIVLLHAFGEAVAGLTGSKQPQLVYPGSSTSSVSLAVPSSPYKDDKH